MNNKIIQQVEEYVKSIMSNEVAHDFKHVDRVKNWALQIANKENFEDLEVVVISALMHDIGLTQAEKRSLHGEVGAEMAAKFLTENNLLTQDKIAEICNAIKFHNKNREGDGKLFKILRDADMMDLFGAVGNKTPADRRGFYCCLLCVSERVLVFPIDNDFKVKVGAG